jgi:hypothetical protein
MSGTEEIWRRKTDYEVEAAGQRLDEYTDDGRRIILAELERRRDSIQGRRPLYQLAAQELALGKTTADVERMLVEQGMDRSTASTAVAEVASVEAATHLEVARSKIQRGALFLAVGFVVTSVTYMFASSAGGSYLVAWGAILYGLYEISKGFAASRNR